MECAAKEIVGESSALVVGQIPTHLDHTIGRASFERSDVFSIGSLEFYCIEPILLGQLGVNNRSPRIELG